MSIYNESELELRESIDSILQQSFRDFEFIIIVDNTKNVAIVQLLEKYKDSDNRVNVIINNTNLGLAKSLNTGLENATGRYIARMDADDISTPERLQIQFDYLEHHPDCAAVSANRIDINEKSEALGKETKFLLSDEQVKKIMPYGSVIIHSTVMIRKVVIDSLHGYRNMRAAQDYDLWLRMISSGYTIHIMPEKLIKFRIRSNSISNQNFFGQYIYSKYALKKFKQRVNNDGRDTYSKSELHDYLNKYKVTDTSYCKNVNMKYSEIWRKSQVGFLRVFKIFLSIIQYPVLASILLRGVLFKKLLNRFTI